MDLAHACQTRSRQAIRRPYERRPQPPMDERDLALDEAAHENIIAVADGACHGEDLAAFRMRPPVTANRRARDGLGQRRHRSTRGFENDAVLPNERKRLA